MTQDAHLPPAASEVSLVEAVWRFRTMSLLIVAACALMSIGVTELLFGDTQATARFAVTDPTNGNSLKQGVVSGQGYATYTAQRAAFAHSAPVLRRAGQILAAKRGPKMSLETMRQRVKTATQPEGGVVEVTASAGSMSLAAGIANAVVQGYQELSAQANRDKVGKQLQAIKEAERKVAENIANARSNGRAVTALTADLAKLQGKESALLADANNSGDGVQFVDTADPSASAPSKLPRNFAIGLAVGVLIACVAAFLRASSPSPSVTPSRRRRRDPVVEEFDGVDLRLPSHRRGSARQVTDRSRTPGRPSRALPPGRSTANGTVAGSGGAVDGLRFDAGVHYDAAFTDQGKSPSFPDPTRIGPSHTENGASSSTTSASDSSSGSSSSRPDPLTDPLKANDDEWTMPPPPPALALVEEERRKRAAEAQAEEDPGGVATTRHDLTALTNYDEPGR